MFDAKNKILLCASICLRLLFRIIYLRTLFVPAVSRYSYDEKRFGF